MADVYRVERDPKDSKYVNLTIAAGANHLVSWDHHLLQLMDEATDAGREFRARFPSIRILTPPEFVRGYAGV